MGKFPFLLFVVPLLLVAQNARSQNTKDASANASIAGRWVVSADFYGTPLTFSMELK